MALSDAAMQLHRLLEENSEEADAVRLRFHRTILWRWRIGKGKPSSESAGELEALSRGRVQANGWVDLDEKAAG